jgi:transglutaminase-like putative cysteine protease
MYYSIRHLTKFLYSNAVSESMMETRMHPRSDQNQRCLTFHLSVSPRCRVFSYRDHLANQVHHFDIPGQHGQLVIVAESLVEIQPAPQIPAFLAPDAWAELDSMIEQGDYWEMLFPSEFAAPTPALDALAQAFDVRRRDDPLMVLHQLNEQIYKYFDYVPKSTKVDSPIDLALTTHKGVCQDFAHIMLACLRSYGLAARYVSGYLRTTPAAGSEASPLGADASHAWVSVFCPPFGWIDLDPTNDVRVGTGHIVIAWGRDFGDVSPLRGVIVGGGKHRLSVRVSVQAE